jgi:small subunit ribosomal protein S6
MRNYEIIYIVHPDLDDAAFTEVTEKVNNWITEAKGEVTKADHWGKKRLAYPINKQIEGNYMYLETTMDTEVCPLLEGNFKMMESVMRFMIVVKE